MSNVSETEMNDFFNRIASTFVGLSSQAEELKRLKPEFEWLQNSLQSLNARLENMERSNSTLRDDLRTTLETVRQAEADRDEYKAEVSRLTNENETLERQAATMQGTI